MSEEKSDSGVGGKLSEHLLNDVKRLEEEIGRTVSMLKNWEFKTVEEHQVAVRTLIDTISFKHTLFGMYYHPQQ